MEVTFYNRHTDYKKKGKPPIIRIDAHSGNARIQISVEAVKLLKLKEGDCLTFMTLKNDKDTIYFYIDNKDGIPLKTANEHKSGIDMGVYCRPLARKLLDHCPNKQYAIVYHHRCKNYMPGPNLLCDR